MAQRFYGRAAISEQKKKDYLNTEHIWKTSNHDTIEHEANYIDIFANMSDDHNGPVCILCGYDECWHCTPKPPKKCSGRKI